MFQKKQILLEMKIFVLITSILMVVASSSVAQEYNQNQTQKTQMASHYVIVENTSAWPGTMEHSINITGEFSSEIFGYHVEVYFETIREDEVVPVEVNFDNCIYENPEYLTVDVVHSYNVNIIKITNFFTYNWTPGNGVLPGEGKLFSIIVNISGDAWPQNIEIGDIILAGAPQFYNLAGGETEMINGYLEILRTPNPPNPPEKPHGPTYGSINSQYAYSTKNLPGANIWYKFCFGDYESDWFQPDMYGNPSMRYSWEEPGIYEVKVKAKNNFDDESNWSEPLTVNISSLAVTSITGGFGITATIQNKGNLSASDIDWTMTIDGGLFMIIKKKSGTINSIGSGEIKEIKMMPLGVGIGLKSDFPILTVTAQVPGEPPIVTTTEVIVLMFFTSI